MTIACVIKSPSLASATSNISCSVPTRNQSSSNCSQHYQRSFSASSSREKVLISIMKASPKRQTRSWRTSCGMDIGHTILLFVAITAVMFIALDGLIESDQFSILKHNLPTQIDDLTRLLERTKSHHSRLVTLWYACSLSSQSYDPAFADRLYD
jgi:hypothetical protein